MTGADRFNIPQTVLLALAALLAWRPVETHPWSAVITAAVVLALSSWGWRRTSVTLAHSLAVATVSGILLFIAGLSGWDPASAVSELALLAAVISLVWLGSRETPPNHLPALLALLLSGLAFWGLWQVVAGFEGAIPRVAELPEPMRFAAAERLASGRAFASQLLPSHLAVLLATALPLLVVRVRRRWSTAVWIVASILCIVGLVLTRSPVGIGLALIACTALAFIGRGSRSLTTVLVLAIALAAVVLFRGDVLEFEPVLLRFDNWRTALWVWSTAPAVGVGPAGFAQAAQAVPFTVGNFPRHAHSLPLEWLAELGPTGLVVFVVMAIGLSQLVRDLWRRRPELAIAVVVIPLHNLVDFSLFGSGVALPWAVLLGWAIACRRRVAPAKAAPQGRTVFVFVATLALALTLLHATSRTVGESAAHNGSPEERLAGTLQARRLAPWRVEPLGQVAAASLESRNFELIIIAAEEFERAQWLAPRSAAFAGLRARLGLALKEGPTAISDAWRARQERPNREEHARFYKKLILRLDRETGRASR